MMCDTSLTNAAKGHRTAAHRVAGACSRRPETQLTSANEEIAKVIDKP